MWVMPVWKCRLQRKQVNMPMQKSQMRFWRILRTMTKTRCRSAISSEVNAGSGVPG